MSRETDSPSSGPHGRGGAAYPSGTPPYGTPTAPDDGPGAGSGGPAAPRPEDRKTETTLTTRVRINIPGSRPIPPVVMRKTVAGDGNAGAEPEAVPGPPVPGVGAPGGGAPAAGGGAPAEPASAGPPEQPAEERPASDWFAPRKSAPNAGGPGTGAANGAGTPGASGPGAAGSGPAAGRSGPPAGVSGPTAGTTGTGPGANGAGARPGGTAGRPGGVVGAMHVPGGSRPGSNRPGAPGGSGLPGATGGPVAPGHGGGTGSFDVTDALAAAGQQGDGRPTGDGTGAEPSRDDLPYFTGDPTGAGGPGDTAAPYGGPQGPAGPAGPTGGPVTGDARLTPPPAAGGSRAPRGPGAGSSDDTAILTPQVPAPVPGGQGPGGQGPGPFGAANPDNVSGNTVTSGIPVVPGGTDRGTPFGAPATAGPRAHTPPKLPEPVAEPPAASSSAPARKKGRRKLPLLVGAVVVVAGVAYGAGLLMNRSDVPKGTTVLGVDIGGGTRDDAVEKLDAALGPRTGKALKLTVGGDTVTLRPDQAGLQFDAQATASAATGSDYNPVSVIGSLFGNHRVVDPVMPVDEEKLHAALARAAGGAGSATEGTIKFESGKAVPVYGKPGKGIDAAGSTQAVADAYRAQVETGNSTPVEVPTTEKQPTITKAEVDRMLKEFAEPAMSARITVRAGVQSIAFSPEKSLWKFLGVKAQNGKLVEYYDQAALKGLYGNTFDSVLVTRATGQKTPVTVQDVIGAMRPALLSKTNRVAVVDTNPS
ncbi:hypothetical protein ACGFZL_29925 [Streptomyces sp. NPDC048182]|uniref:hypothetical protein n=1 Tax=Streptomyces sp. NPDC048182 TaxID=3365507 RepID=UPI003714FB2D